MCIFNLDVNNLEARTELGKKLPSLQGITAFSVTARGAICVSFLPTQISAVAMQDKIEAIAGKALPLMTQNNGAVCPMDKIGVWFSFN